MSVAPVAPVDLGASAGVDLVIGLLTIFCTGEFPPTPLILLMAITLLAKALTARAGDSIA